MIGKSNKGEFSSDRAILKNSFLVGTAQILGVASGLLLDVLVISFFGVGLLTDAIFVSLTIPLIFYSVIVSVSIRVLSPLLAQAFDEGGQSNLNTVFSSAINYLTVALLCVTVTGLLTSGWIVSQFGLSQDGLDIARLAFQILAVSLIPLGIIETIKALLVNHGYFFLSSLSNFLRYSLSILTLVLFKDNFGIMALALAYVSGAFGQMVFYQAVYHRLTQTTYRPTFGRREKAFSRLVERLGPPLLGELVGQSNVLVEIYFASFLPTGVVSVFGYGRRALSAANGLMANSVVIAMLPRLTAEAIKNHFPQLRQTIFLGIKLISFVAGFISVLLISFSAPFNLLLIYTGRFPDALSVHIATELLIVLGPTLLLMGIAQILNAPFYAFGETRIVFVFRVLYLVINLAITAAMVALFQAEGLVFALVTSLLVQVIIWLVALSRRIHGLGSALYRFLLKYAVLIGLLGAIFYYASHLIRTTTLAATILEMITYSTLITIAFIFLALRLGLLERSSRLVSFFTAVKQAFSRHFSES